MAPDSLRNHYGSPFTEIKDYTDGTSFGPFYEQYGSRNCSAWGVNSAGCLGLLAVAQAALGLVPHLNLNLNQSNPASSTSYSDHDDSSYITP
ncbi:hypothetical protein F4677DRAFT_443168 [Hypoxylon crocopeplum]|nr:hypothetical protein F4677DRAFT_443168 [Hypoxylon crocopeplum]